MNIKNYVYYKLNKRKYNNIHIINTVLFFYDKLYDFYLKNHTIYHKKT